MKKKTLVTWIYRKHGGWWYNLDNNGEGRAINFPIKIKPLLSWTPKRYVVQNGKLMQAERTPVEKAKIHFARRACSAETL